MGEGLKERRDFFQVLTQSGRGLLERGELHKEGRLNRAFTADTQHLQSWQKLLRKCVLSVMECKRSVTALETVTERC